MRAPAALNGIFVAKEVFAERDRAESNRTDCTGRPGGAAKLRAPVTI
jgi:hypothetical protein